MFVLRGVRSIFLLSCHVSTIICLCFADFQSVDSVSAQPPVSKGDVDLISDLLEKGQRLRSAMITSTVDRERDTESEMPYKSQFPKSR